MLELNEAAAILKCSTATLEDHLRSGHIAGTKFGVSWVIPRVAFFERVNQIALDEAAKRREPPLDLHRKPMPQVDAPKVGRRNRLAIVSF